MCHSHSSYLPTLTGTLFASMLACVAPSLHAMENLPTPHHITVANKKAAAPQILAARRYAAFWNTGDPAFARAALASDFMDRTLPAGRAQGVNGPLQASLTFRTAIPDLTTQIEDMVVTGERVVVRLRFKGHFTGRFGDTEGKGQPVDFRAFDLYRVANGRITENWHLEDNLSLMQQMGIMK